MDSNNIIESLKYVKIVLYAIQGDEIPEEDEYDSDKESIVTPNKSISGIKNPNINFLNDSNNKLFQKNNPKVEKINLDISQENSDYNKKLKNVNDENPLVFKNLQDQKEIESLNKKCCKSNLDVELDNKTKSLKEDNTKQFSNCNKNYLIQSIHEENIGNEHSKYNRYQDIILNSHTNIENSNEENIFEEDIIISEINENLKTPNVNMRQISNHFINKKNSDTNQNNDKEHILLKRNIIKFNSENNYSEEGNKIINPNLIKFTSRNGKSNINNMNVYKYSSGSFINSNENSQNNMTKNIENQNIPNSDFNINQLKDNFNSINFKKKKEDKKGENKLNDSTAKDRELEIFNYNSNGAGNFNKRKQVIKNINTTYDFSSSELNIDYKNKNCNGNLSNLSELKAFISEGYENQNLKRIKSCSENIRSHRSRTADPSKEDPGSPYKKKKSLRQKETIIFNQEDILEYLHFKEWKKKIGVFFDKIKELMLNFTSCLNIIDQSYSWIQKRFLKDNLKRIKKSYKTKSEMYRNFNTTH